MKIDWFTVGAQVVNFLILVWLLKRFLYKPILDAIDAREERVAKSIADAEAKQANADQEQETFQSKNKEFDEQKEGLLTEAKDKAETERKRLFDEARQAVEALRAKQEGELRREQQSLADEVTRRTQAEVFALARQTLAQLAGTTLEERMAEVFTDRLQELEPAAKEDLRKALSESGDPLLVRSAFELPTAQREALQAALNGAFSADVKTEFEIAPVLVSGIELVAEGRKVAWSIADYLCSLEKTVAGMLQEPPSPPAAPEEAK